VNAKMATRRARKETNKTSKKRNLLELNSECKLAQFLLLLVLLHVEIPRHTLLYGLGFRV
jgi:hypothetical protein